MLATSLDLEVRSLAQLYRDRADAENGFDELKNQWGWGGFTTRDLTRCRHMARLIALIYIWWSLFVRLADPERHRASPAATTIATPARRGWSTCLARTEGDRCGKPPIDSSVESPSNRQMGCYIVSTLACLMQRTGVLLHRHRHHPDDVEEEALARG